MLQILIFFTPMNYALYRPLIQNGLAAERDWDTLGDDFRAHIVSITTTITHSVS